MPINTRNRASRLTGNDLRRLRQLAGLTSVELAAMMDVHPASIRGLESGRSVSRSLARLYLLCVAHDGQEHVREALVQAHFLLS
jgi:transcriptional regulator with XRE-family HTH domain